MRCVKAASSFELTLTSNTPKTMHIVFSVMQHTTIHSYGLYRKENWSAIYNAATHVSSDSNVNWPLRVYLFTQASRTKDSHIFFYQFSLEKSVNPE